MREQAKPVSRTPIGPFPAEHSFEAGVVLAGTYRILCPIAAGGMGEVYAAAHERLPGRFAVKVLHRDLTRDDEALSRFRYEAEIMAGLRHPNIVQVIDFNITEDGTPYLVMELVDGVDLAESLREGQRLAPAQAAHMIHQIASALEAAHARGVVHRDLKPENIMRLSLEGQEDFIKVVDFGISKARRMRITAETAILGTPQFMAPEQAQGRREEIDHRTDQFALAAMAYLLLTGREPFRGDTAVTILYQVVHQDPDPLSRYVDWPCEHVDAVLRRGLAKERSQRFPSVMEFARALDEAIAADVGIERTPTPRLRLVTPPTQPNRDTIAESDWSLKTVRLQTGLRRRATAASLVAAATVALAVLYLDTVGWENVGSAVGGAYQQAVAATSRTVARLRHPLPAPVLSPEAPHGPEIIPLPVVSSSPESAKAGAASTEAARPASLP
ncbi:MAG TPA: serine/threonine-protein kinase [Polyangia bacterium]|nr:serine/threonine-protein kinase [Polyangia bacterium]